jgi:hypothetical protein
VSKAICNTVYLASTCSSIICCLVINPIQLSCGGCMQLGLDCLQRSVAVCTFCLFGMSMLRSQPAVCSL